MHLVQKVMSGSMQAPLPALLPPGLYESAAGSSTSAPALPPSASVPRQLTGQPASSAPANSSPLRQQYTGQQPFGRPGVTAMPAWSITPAEKMQSDGWFDGLPKNGDGLIEGPAAVEFFMKSTLDQTTLAAIWCVSYFRARRRALLTPVQGSLRHAQLGHAQQGRICRRDTAYQ